MITENQKLKKRYEFVKNQNLINNQTNASSMGCQTNCAGCVGIN